MRAPFLRLRRLARMAVARWFSWRVTKALPELAAIRREIGTARSRHGRVKPLAKRQSDIVHARLRAEQGK